MDVRGAGQIGRRKLEGRARAALGEQRRPLSELMADYERYEASGEINFTVDDSERCVDAVLRSFGQQIVSIDHLDGVLVLDRISKEARKEAMRSMREAQRAPSSA